MAKSFFVGFLECLNVRIFEGLVEEGIIALKLLPIEHKKLWNM